MKPLIELQHINLATGQNWPWKISACTCTKASFAALVGPSGAGKTTLLKVILGLLQPTRGHFMV